MEATNKASKSDGNIADFIGFSFWPPPADKLVLRGKLLPRKPIPPPPPPPPATAAQRKKVSPLRLRRAELPDSQDIGRYRKAGAGEYRRLRRTTSPESTAEAIGGKCSKRAPCVLGVAKLPAEMEMKDIKTRQRRLGPPPLTAEKGRRGDLYWGFLQSLSCKATESTAVAPVNAERRQVSSAFVRRCER